MTQGALTYREQALHYLENAHSFLRAGDVGKASEFLWGSIAEAFKALAASRGLLMRSHGELWRYAREAARELGDESLHSAFVEASALHANFYENDRTAEDIQAIAPRIHAAVVKILGAMPEGQASQ